MSSYDERYSILGKIDESGQLSQFVDETAISYVDNYASAKILFENGNGVYIGDGRVVPYHAFDDKEEVLTLRTMRLSGMSTEDIVGVLKSVESGEIQASLAREADMLRESPVTLDERIQNGKFIDSAERIFGDDAVKLYSFMRDHELGGIGRVDSSGHSISVVLYDEGKYGTCDLLYASNYGERVSISHVVWDDPQDHPANAPSVPSHTVINGTQEEVVDKLDKILTHFQQVYAEETAKTTENTAANRYEEIANATGISLTEVTNNSAFFDKAYELLGDRAGVAYLFMLDNEKDATVTIEDDKMIIDVKTDNGKWFTRNEHVTVILDEGRVSIDHNGDRAIYLADISNSNTAFSIARDILTEHDLKINGHADDFERLQMLEHQKDVLSQKEMLFEVGRVFAQMEMKEFTPNERAIFVETFDKLGIPTYPELAAQRNAEGTSIDGKMLGELIMDGDEAAIAHMVQQFRFGTDSINYGVYHFFGDEGQAADTIRNAMMRELEETAESDNEFTKGDGDSFSFDM